MPPALHEVASRNGASSASRVGEVYVPVALLGRPPFPRGRAAHRANDVRAVTLWRSTWEGQIAFGKRRLRRQLLQQRLGLFQIERSKAFGEPAADRWEKITRLIRSSVELGAGLSFASHIG